MTHLIENYDQVKLRLSQLTKQHQDCTRDYYFAVGDLFNQNVPAAAHLGGATGGISAAVYGRRLSVEIDKLLSETNTDISHKQLTHIRSTARAWPKAERKYDVPFTVYLVLCKHKELIHDGMTTTEARDAVSALNDEIPAAISKRVQLKLAADGLTLKSFNRTQRLRIGINNIRSVIDHDDGTPLDQEQIELIGEVYGILDAYTERKGINMMPEPELAVEA